MSEIVIQNDTQFSDDYIVIYLAAALKSGNGSLVQPHTGYFYGTMVEIVVLPEGRYIVKEVKDA